jgi:hypothetical protein
MWTPVQKWGVDVLGQQLLDVVYRMVGDAGQHLAQKGFRVDKTRPDLVLAPLQETDKIQWNFTTRSNQPMTAEEASAYARLSAKLATQSNGTEVQVTGPLKKNGSEFFLEVREFKI